MTAKQRKLFKYCVNPKHWPAICIILLILLLIQLPRFLYTPFLGLFTLLVKFIFGPRLKVVNTNLKLCFPDYSDKKRRSIAKAFLKSTVTTLFDTVYLYYNQFFSRLPYTVTGEEKLKSALKGNQPVILLTVHMNTSLLAGKFIHDIAKQKVANVFQEQTHPLISYFYERKQYQYFSAIKKNNIRKMIRLLNKKTPVIYLFDLNDTKGKTFIPFFNVPAATKTAILKITELTNATVLPYACVKGDDKKYHLSFYDTLNNFPSQNIESDLIKISKLFETVIREHPEQYLWTHRRFKTRPAGEDNPY